MPARLVQQRACWNRSVPSCINGTEWFHFALDGQQPMATAIASLALTAALILGSPGPAPIALAASSATFGLRRALPFYLGIMTGLALVALAAAAGLGALFSQFPNFRRVLEAVAALYIVYLAYRIATASPPGDPANAGGAPRFRDGVLLNVLNPKSYAAFVAIFSQSLLPIESPLWAYGLTAGTCLGVAASTNLVWMASGQLLTSWLRRPRAARVIRSVLATAMVAAVFWAMFG
ncbi:LysE family translocator [Salinisphaera sp. S4-8]|uniref:LysE family translocator n=1 Tax=Salinisphaera sp. S4-8 TaxID=633357 RepID=UPI00334108C8